MEIDSEVTPRLVVTRVRPTAAGPFEPGDVLLSVGQREISGQQDLLRVLRGDLVNKTVPVRVSRNGAQMWIDCVPSQVQPS